VGECAIRKSARLGGKKTKRVGTLGTIVRCEGGKRGNGVVHKFLAGSVGSKQFKATRAYGLRAEEGGIRPGELQRFNVRHAKKRTGIISIPLNGGQRTRERAGHQKRFRDKGIGGTPQHSIKGSAGRSKKKKAISTV